MCSSDLNVMKMNVYQEISQIIKEADGILIGASNGLSIAEGYNIFADDAWFQKNMGDFREKYGLYCVLQGFSVPMKVEEKWAFVSRLVKAKAMQDEPSEIMKNIYALVKDKEYFVVTSNAEDHFVPAGFEADRVFEMEGPTGCGPTPKDSFRESPSTRPPAIFSSRSAKAGAPPPPAPAPRDMERMMKNHAPMITTHGSRLIRIEVQSLALFS